MSSQKKLDMKWLILNRKYVLLGVFAVIALAMLLVSIFVMHSPIVTAGAFVVLETLLAALLNNTPVWLHGVILFCQLLAGFLFGNIVFMILMAVVYAAAVMALYLYNMDLPTAKKAA